MVIIYLNILFWEKKQQDAFGAACRNQFLSSRGGEGINEALVNKWGSNKFFVHWAPLISWLGPFSNVMAFSWLLPSCNSSLLL